MTEFTVELANRPGMLAALVSRLADAGVEIEALATFSHGDHATARLIVDDEPATRQVMIDADLRFEERTIITTVLPHTGRALADLTRDLAASGVNIDALYLIHTNTEERQFAVAVDDPDAARARLSGR